MKKRPKATIMPMQRTIGGLQAEFVALGVQEKEEAVPLLMSKQRFFFIASIKADVAALRRVVVWHDAAFTPATQYPTAADHNVELIYHLYLASSLFGKYSQAEMGIEGVRALEQLVGVANVIFRSKREMIFFFAGEIRRWKG